MKSLENSSWDLVGSFLSVAVGFCSVKCCYRVVYGGGKASKESMVVPTCALHEIQYQLVRQVCPMVTMGPILQEEITAYYYNPGPEL